MIAFFGYKSVRNLQNPLYEMKINIVAYKFNLHSVKVNTNCGGYYSSDFCVCRQMASRIKMVLTFLASGRIPSKLLYKNRTPTRRHVSLQVTGVVVSVIVVRQLGRSVRLQAGSEHSVVISAFGFSKVNFVSSAEKNRLISKFRYDCGVILSNATSFFNTVHMKIQHKCL